MKNARKQYEINNPNNETEHSVSMILAFLFSHAILLLGIVIIVQLALQGKYSLTLRTVITEYLVHNQA